jgi:lipopolysaccharide/colanic/teichoic acid biosynthesis glycosyltransferase
VTKRIFDLVLAGVGLLILSPVLLAIATWVRLDSTGPALFRQERVGRYGRPFTMLKFRTMRSGPQPAGSLLTVARDARVTIAGRFLRRTKIDELPQLINVIRGEMSLVGPRPEVARYVARYPPDVRATVLSVRPGITDYAALAYRDESSLLASGDAEAIYVSTILPRKLAMYQRYVAEQSLRTDLRLILLTLRALIRRDGPDEDSGSGLP